MSNDIADHPEHCIAIVGMAGRFPGAEDVYEYWQNLHAVRKVYPNQATVKGNT